MSDLIRGMMTVKDPKHVIDAYYICKSCPGIKIVRIKEKLKKL